LNKNALIIIGLCLLTPVLLMTAVSFGSVSIGIGSVFDVLTHPFRGANSTFDETTYTIVTLHRLPRAMAAFFVGGGLSIIGVSMQALVRNPLAEPYILGISSGASAGASLFFLGFLPPLIAGWISLPLAAFIGAFISITTVYLVAHSNGTVSVSRLLLAGVAMAALMGALTSLITFASPDANRLRAVLFWLLGSLSNYSWSNLTLPAAASTMALVILFVLSRHLDTLLLGEEPARSLGVPVEAVKRILILLAALVVGVLVAFSGAIGFVGLIVPHVTRFLVGVNHRYVLPVSFLGGGLFLLMADLLARTLIPAQDLPVGVVTAIAGVPFFLVLLRRNQYQFS
jgi:iron complex transport system permease protein